jgi:drug/metabolite transporter (DMT)-like permease
MIKYILVPVGAVLTAIAQIGLKKTSTFDNWSRPWFLFMLLSIALYGIAFFNYLYLLRQFPISKIYPIMTVVVILIITAYGFLIGETINLRHMFGIALGIGSVYLLLF